mmetsp:Transcript_57313/g.115026  ORF Transcript_57313/g.115026 Transcript_57313/m.115026 type:complete len:356 (-) Transcript_57313:79-1146(-)
MKAVAKTRARLFLLARPCLYWRRASHGRLVTATVGGQAVPTRLARGMQLGSLRKRLERSTLPSPFWRRGPPPPPRRPCRQQQPRARALRYSPRLQNRATSPCACLLPRHRHQHPPCSGASTTTANEPTLPTETQQQQQQQQQIQMQMQMQQGHNQTINSGMVYAAQQNSSQLQTDGFGDFQDSQGDDQTQSVAPSSTAAAAAALTGLDSLTANDSAKNNLPATVATTNGTTSSSFHGLGDFKSSPPIAGMDGASTLMGQHNFGMGQTMGGGGCTHVAQPNYMMGHTQMQPAYNQAPAGGYQPTMSSPAMAQGSMGMMPGQLIFGQNQMPGTAAQGQAQMHQQQQQQQQQQQRPSF